MLLGFRNEEEVYIPQAESVVVIAPLYCVPFAFCPLADFLDKTTTILAFYC